jgi:hypothetical protein
MNRLLRIGCSLTWRLAIAWGVFNAGTFVAIHVQLLRGRTWGMPVSHVLASRFSLHTFYLLAIGLSVWATLNPQGRQWRAVAGTSLLYATVAWMWFGGWAGDIDRPYLLLYIISSGVAGLVAPWVMQTLVTRVAHVYTLTDRARLS